MVLSLTNRAWTKLHRISCITQNNKFMLSIGADRFNGIQYTLKPYNQEKFNKQPMKWERNINGFKNIVHLHPFLENLIDSVDIDYQRSNYESELFESRFVFDVKYPDNTGYFHEKTPRQNKYKKNYNVSDQPNYNLNKQNKDLPLADNEEYYKKLENNTKLDNISWEEAFHVKSNIKTPMVVANYIKVNDRPMCDELLFNENNISWHMM